jgi:hypothetical protein
MEAVEDMLVCREFGVAVMLGMNPVEWMDARHGRRE